jgi:hypothetical protein
MLATVFVVTPRIGFEGEARGVWFSEAPMIRCRSRCASQKLHPQAERTTLLGDDGQRCAQGALDRVL